MLTVGEFAALAGVSVRMLHHYHRLGLLVPDRVEPRTGYRLYEAHQLARLHRILQLKDLGVRLNDMADLLSAETTDRALREVLVDRERALTVELDAHAARLRALRGWIAELEHSPESRSFPVVVKRRPALSAVFLSASIEGWRPGDFPVITSIFDQLGPEVYRRLFAAGHARLDRHFTFLDWAACTANFCVPVEPGTEIAGMDAITFPERLVASVVTTPPFESPPLARQAIGRWISANGFVSAGPQLDVVLHIQRNEQERIERIVLEHEQFIEPAAA